MDIRITSKSLLGLSLLLLFLTLLLVNCASPSDLPTADTTAQTGIVPPADVSADIIKHTSDTKPDTSAPENVTTEPLAEPETSLETEPEAVTEAATVFEWNTTIEAQIPPSPDITYHYIDSTLNRQASTNDATVFAVHCAPAIDPSYHYAAIAVSIWFDYPEPQPCTCYQSLDENMTMEEVNAVTEAHLAHLRAHNIAHQQSFRDECGLSATSSDYSLVHSNITAHTSLFFHSYESFARTLPHLASLTSHSLVSHIDIQQQSNPYLEPDPFLVLD